ANLTIRILNVASVAHQPADLGKLTDIINRGDHVARRQIDQLDTSADEKAIAADEQRIGALARETSEGRINLAAGAGVEDWDLQPGGAGGGLGFWKWGPGGGRVGGIAQPRHTSRAGHEFTQELQPLCRQLALEKIDACQVAARPGEACNKTEPDGSSLTLKTMGIVVVAALAAIGEAGPPVATITDTWRRTSSAASAGSRSNCPSAQRYSIARFSPST